VGVEEKGLLRVKIKATTHRNRRPFTRVSEESAVIRLARAVSRFKHDVHPTIMTDFVRAMIWHVAPYASFPYNMVLANMWLFRPLLEMLMANEDNTSGFVRTTTAVTIIRGGLLDTVVPEVAEAFVTHCVLPELSVAETLRRDCEILGNINNVTAAVDNWIPPVERNPLGRQKLGYTELPKDVGFVALQESIGAVFPFAIVVPSLMTTPTASRYYVNLTRYIYRYETISYDSDEKNEADKRQKAKQALVDFREFILTNFSQIFERDFIKVLNNETSDSALDSCGNSSYPSLLLQIEGANTELSPYMLCAHMDVVPSNDVGSNGFVAKEVTSEQNETFIYGRGALDDKHNLMSIMEVLNELKIRPNRTFYVAFGHDEEILGNHGAHEMAKCLSQILETNRGGQKLAFVLDEGLFVLNGSMPMIDKPLAFIGVAEKGFLNVNVSVTDSRGHSSFPPQETAITKLARAISRFTNDAHPAELTDLHSRMIWKLAPYANFPANMIMANMWLFSPIVEKMMANQEKTSALMRTSTAVTKIRGGEKTNMLPGYAEAIVNHRVMPGQTLDEVLQYDRDLVKDIPNITINMHEWRAPVDFNPIRDDSDNTNLTKPLTEVGLIALEQTIGAVFPSAVVVPTILMAATDSRHYANLTHYIYRFSPLNINVEETSGIHGDGERISVNQYRMMCNFYWHLIKTMGRLNDNSSVPLTEEDY
ncbi:putative carboxypeptidase PM20D1-like, partial [Tropilaelaps mercedesae]